MRKFYQNRQQILFIVIIAASVLGLWLLISQLQGRLEQGYEPYVSLYLHQKDQTVQIKFEEYLVGAVAGEMPASFAMDALKAQAVCARTYAMRKLLERHVYPQGADLSDDIHSCQAYISTEDFYKSDPRYRQQLLARIRQAVHETRGVIMTSNGEPIDALYHSTCGGQTERAGEVWLQDLPYLNPVTCSYCQASKHYETIQVFSAQQLHDVTGIDCSEELAVEVLATTSSGRIKTLSINRITISGEEFRQKLGLPSNWLEFNTGPGELVITCHGYGHGVGMCQYGAHGMAGEGADYRVILRQYYGDIQLDKINYDVLE